MIVKKTAPELSLPDKPSEPVRNIAEYSILLYGREKIGKTTFAAQFPDTFFLLFEPGGKALSIYRREVTTWREFLGYIKLLKETDQFKTVVIDTVDLCYKRCYDHINKELGIDHPSEEDWAKAWNMIKDEFTRAMATIQNLGRGVIFISHAQDKELKKRYGGSEHRIVPTMPKQARDVLEPMADIWMYAEYDPEGNRQFIIRGDQMIAAGHRLQDHFIGIDHIPMGKSPKDAYRNFIAAFDNRSMTEVRSNSNNTKVKIKGGK
jgi:hypothetical protein